MDKTIIYKDEEYEIPFNLNVMEAIQEEYGSLEAWFDIISGENVSIKAIKFGIREMLNEGIDIFNETAEKEAKRKAFTSKQVGRIVTEIGMHNLYNVMTESIEESTKSDEKNA